MDQVFDPNNITLNPIQSMDIEHSDLLILLLDVVDKCLQGLCFSFNALKSVQCFQFLINGIDIATELLSDHLGII